MDTDVLNWLLEPSQEYCGVRYFALRNLLDRPADDVELIEARDAVMQSAEVCKILAAQDVEGYWAKGGRGYSPKYRGTVWQLIFLARLGANGQNEQIRHACEYYLEHAAINMGGFTCSNGRNPADGVLHCLDGNMLHALTWFGYGEDQRVQAAWEVLCKVTLGKQADLLRMKKGFVCEVNQDQMCAWGVIKVLRALVLLGREHWTEPMQQTADMGVALLLAGNLCRADYPVTEKVSPKWFSFGFPLPWWSDILEAVEVLVDLGYAQEAVVQEALQYILSKRDPKGCWKMEDNLRSRSWVNIEKNGKPSKWITLRAMQVLHKAEQ